MKAVGMLGLAAVALLTTCRSEVSSQPQDLRSVSLDSALASAVDAVLTSIAHAGVPCDVEGALPVAFWPSWRHRGLQSLVRVDRGCGEFLARELEQRLPCRTALRGAERDAVMRELQLEAQPFYDSAHPRFRSAGREFARSLYLVAGDWWKAESDRVVFTVEVYHLLLGERLASGVENGDLTYAVAVSSIPSQRIRESLLPHVLIDVAEEFDEDARHDLGFSRRASILQGMIHDSLMSRGAGPRPVLVVDDTSAADVVVSGTVSFSTCPLTPLMREIIGDTPTYAYTTETRLRVRWPSGRSAVWASPQIHPCPPVSGPTRRRSDPMAAYMQARDWTLVGEGRPTVAASAAGWVRRTVCSEW